MNCLRLDNKINNDKKFDFSKLFEINLVLTSNYLSDAVCQLFLFDLFRFGFDSDSGLIHFTIQF